MAARFEIGAHTMTHGDLRGMDPAWVAGEMGASLRYVEDLTGSACRCFAPPGGRFRSAHLAMAAAAGFRGFRTVELMNTAAPVVYGDLAVMGTTLQVFPHGTGAYLRNAAKRWRPGNAAKFLRHARGAALPRAAVALAGAAAARGGVFHLWGHAWEIEDLGLWGELREVLAALGDEFGRCRWMGNGELCEEVLRDESVTGIVAGSAVS